MKAHLAGYILLPGGHLVQRGFIYQFKPEYIIGVAMNKGDSGDYIQIHTHGELSLNKEEQIRELKGAVIYGSNASTTKNIR